MYVFQAKWLDLIKLRDANVEPVAVAVESKDTVYTIKQTPRRGEIKLFTGNLTEIANAISDEFSILHDAKNLAEFMEMLGGEFEIIEAVEPAQNEETIVTPAVIARIVQSTKKGISYRVKLLYEICGITLVRKGENYFSPAEMEISLVSLRTKFDFAIAMHELAHFLFCHSTINTVQQECEADLFADAVCDLIYKNGGYLFGSRLVADEVYSGELDEGKLFDFCEKYGIKKPDIASTAAEVAFFCSKTAIDVTKPEQVAIADSNSTSEDAMEWAIKQGLLKLDQDRSGLNAQQNQLLELMDNNDGVLTADNAALFSEHDILYLLVYKFIHYYNNGTEYALPHKWFESMMAQAQTKTDAIIGKFVEALDAVDDEITNEHSVLKQIRMNEQITIWWDCPFKHFSESSANVKILSGIGWRCFLELKGVVNGVEKSWIEQGGDFLESLEKGRYRLNRRYVEK
jgi:hypothetical protein